MDPAFVDTASIVTTDLALLADRRAGIAALLGALLLEEPGKRVADLVSGVPALAALGSGDPAVPVEYERVFLRGVPLYESGFRSDDGQHGGAALGAVIERYAALGFDEHWLGRWRVAGADHLGLELRCYAGLCRTEADSWRGDTPDAAMAAVERERTFLADHVSAWAPVALRAARELAGDGVYRPLLDAVQDFLGEEHERLRPAPALGEPVRVDALPEHMGPARLARLLLAPATSGTWLLPAHIQAAAAAIGAPWRRSDTRTSLRHVIEEAAGTGELAAVLTALEPVIASERDGYVAMAASDAGAAAHWLAWAERATGILALVDRIVTGGRLDAGTGSDGARVAETLVISAADAGALADAIDRVVEALRQQGLRVERHAGAPVSQVSETLAASSSGTPATRVSEPARTDALD